MIRVPHGEESQIVKVRGQHLCKIRFRLVHGAHIS